MQRVSVQTVLEPLYIFLQMAYGPDTKSLEQLPFSKEAERWLFERLGGSPITVKEATQLEPSKKRVLSMLLKQYVVFLTMFKHLTFESGFLKGTTETTLGSPLLGYMLEHRWPFPQLLSQQVS